MKTNVILNLPNSTRLLVAGHAHLDADGRPECGRGSGHGMTPMTLAQALVHVQPVWCPRCFGRGAR